jgi:hypothetical protein
VRKALLCEQGVRTALQAAEEYETGEWAAFQKAMARLSLP